MLIIVSQENVVKDFSTYKAHKAIDNVSKIFRYCYHIQSILAA